MTLVDYLVARNGVLASRGLLYDYVIAGDGLFVSAESEYLYARVPVASAVVRGLPELGSAFDLKLGRVPESIWRGIVERCDRYAWMGEEVMLAVTASDRGYELHMPQQERTATSVRYTPVEHTLLEAHSHNSMRAFFSSTDNADEQDLRVYAVLGKLGTPRQEVALRVGVYGHYLPLPWEWVFEGGKGNWRDVYFDEQGGE